ncbi:MAG: hypothetical protein WCI18_05245 [Pseudomonadota bacterium]
MKYLVLVRHATAESNLVMLDIERCLTDVGHLEASHTARDLIEIWRSNALKPPLIISSPATRTFQTCSYIQKEFESQKLFDGEIDKENHLYRGDMEDWLDVSIHVDESKQGIILVGHNPGISIFASHLVQTELNFAPAQYAVLRADTTWAELNHVKWDLFKSSL